jgi:REP element-mobilizing transposase RayT
MNVNPKHLSGDPVRSRGFPGSVSDETAPRRLRRLHHVWPDRDGNISYLLTICVDGRAHIVDNEAAFERLIAFLLDSPTRYRWFGRRFVVMPDHIHLIAHMGLASKHLGEWIKALKAVVGGLKRADKRPVRTPALSNAADAGRLPSADVPEISSVPAHEQPSRGGGAHEFTRIKRAWSWQEGFHDHKFRTRESETRKWEYVCLNPVRAGLVERPEDWPFGGEIYYDEAGGPRVIRGTPPLLETGILIEDNEEDGKTPPREGTRPAGGTPDRETRPST